MPKRTASQRKPTALAQERYEQQLELRITLGCLLIDALSHGQHDGLAHLHDECSVLEESLEALWRFRRDYPERVISAEVRRVHSPGVTRPADDEEHPCVWCRPEASGVPDDVGLAAWVAA